MKAKTFETFSPISDFQIRMLTNDAPYCFNGNLSVRKYRVTIEPIDEPIEVLRDRLQKLWDECTNHHQWDVMRAEAEKLGMERLEHKRKP